MADIIKIFDKMRVRDRRSSPCGAVGEISSGEPVDVGDATSPTIVDVNLLLDNLDEAWRTVRAASSEEQKRELRVDAWGLEVDLSAAGVEIICPIGHPFDSGIMELSGQCVDPEELKRDPLLVAVSNSGNSFGSVIGVTSFGASNDGRILRKPKVVIHADL